MDWEKHAGFLHEMLRGMVGHEGLDSVQVTLLYFAVCGLDMLHELDNATFTRE